jgi:DNA-binding transcriptional ArsR family regulator
MITPQLRWDWGTAYDLFASLEVLHRPADYGLRAKWAAGVRARVSLQERETLEDLQLVLFSLPLHWIYSLPEPKDATTALWLLRQTPSAERLAELVFPHGASPQLREILDRVAARGTSDEADMEALRDGYRLLTGGEHRLSAERQAAMLKWWSRSGEYGERLLDALQSFQEAFFAEEERRIKPALETWLVRAQDMAQRMSLLDLFEDLSQGLRLTEPPQVAECVLAPSYWCTPFVHWDESVSDRQIWLFGARPADDSLVPGEAVPDALLRTVKALSDPTRLRILRILSHEALIPAELARRLRLRDQTVTHHLNILRLAGLVQIELGESEGKHKEPHAARAEAVGAAFAALQQFLEKQ